MPVKFAEAFSFGRVLHGRTGLIPFNVTRPVMETRPKC